MMNSEEKAGQSYDTFQMGHIHYTWELGRPYIGEIIEHHLLVIAVQRSLRFVEIKFNVDQFGCECSERDLEFVQGIWKISSSHGLWAGFLPSLKAYEILSLSWERTHDVERDSPWERTIDGRFACHKKEGISNQGNHADGHPHWKTRLINAAKYPKQWCFNSMSFHNTPRHSPHQAPEEDTIPLYTRVERISLKEWNDSILWPLRGW